MAEESFFAEVQLTPPDKILGLQANFLADPNPDKVGLIVGAYRDNEGKPYVLPVVRSVETAMANDKTLNHEYLPMEGLHDLVKGAAKLALGMLFQRNRILSYFNIIFPVFTVIS